VHYILGSDIDAIGSLEMQEGPHSRGRFVSRTRNRTRRGRNN